MCLPQVCREWNLVACRRPGTPGLPDVRAPRGSVRPGSLPPCPLHPTLHCGAASSSSCSSCLRCPFSHLLSASVPTEHSALFPRAPFHAVGHHPLLSLLLWEENFPHRLCFLVTPRMLPSLLSAQPLHPPPHLGPSSPLGRPALCKGCHHHGVTQLLHLFSSGSSNPHHSEAQPAILWENA